MLDILVYLNFHSFLSYFSCKLFERKSKLHENQTLVLLKNTYSVTETLTKEENYFSFHFIFVLSYIMFYVCLLCFNYVLLSKNGVHCSYLVLFIGLFLVFNLF